MAFDHHITRLYMMSTCLVIKVTTTWLYQPSSLSNFQYDQQRMLSDDLPKFGMPQMLQEMQEADRHEAHLYRRGCDKPYFDVFKTSWIWNLIKPFSHPSFFQFCARVKGFFHFWKCRSARCFLRQTQHDTACINIPQWVLYIENPPNTNNNSKKPSKKNPETWMWLTISTTGQW